MPPAAKVKSTAPKADPAAAKVAAKAAAEAAAKKEQKAEQMPLEAPSRGRFDKGEPTIVDGQDLDVPTFMRRNVKLK
jgi:cell division protein FtsZ